MFFPTNLATHSQKNINAGQIQPHFSNIEFDAATWNPQTWASFKNGVNKSGARSGFFTDDDPAKMNFSVSSKISFLQNFENCLDLPDLTGTLSAECADKKFIDGDQDCVIFCDSDVKKTIACVCDNDGIFKLGCNYEFPDGECSSNGNKKYSNDELQKLMETYKSEMNAETESKIDKMQQVIDEQMVQLFEEKEDKISAVRMHQIIEKMEVFIEDKIDRNIYNEMKQVKHDKKKMMKKIMLMQLGFGGLSL